MFKAAFKLKKEVAVHQTIIKSLSGQENPDIIQETYKVNAYDPKNQVRLFALFLRLVEARNKELRRIEEENAPPIETDAMGGGDGGGGGYDGGDGNDY